MQKQVKDFFKELRTNSSLSKKFKAVKNQKEFAKVVAPYVNGCDPKKFIEEISEVWEIVNGKKSNKISQKDLAVVAGGLTKKSFKKGADSFLFGFKGVMNIGKEIAKESVDFYKILSGFIH
ncbi:MAG: Nif11-like leader peptide family natural product precursor [Oscillospiraceae bacterium]|jgi:hypothetical protein|nr:Nif11-like leader peptide family natural product precursor [Oscillospiraceae bacterium]